MICFWEVGETVGCYTAVCVCTSGSPSLPASFSLQLLWFSLHAVCARVFWEFKGVCHCIGVTWPAHHICVHLINSCSKAFLYFTLSPTGEIFGPLNLRVHARIHTHTQTHSCGRTNTLKPLGSDHSLGYALLLSINPKTHLADSFKTHQSLLCKGRSFSLQQGSVLLHNRKTSCTHT